MLYRQLSKNLGLYFLYWANFQDHIFFTLTRKKVKETQANVIYFQVHFTKKIKSQKKNFVLSDLTLVAFSRHLATYLFVLLPFLHCPLLENRLTKD